MNAAAVVHTTGINWEATIAIVASVVTVMSIVLGVFVRWVAAQITGAINKFRIDVVSQLDTRLTRVETKVNDIGERQQGRR